MSAEAVGGGALIGSRISVCTILIHHSFVDGPTHDTTT
jgi:hypothetical protein